MRYLSPSNVVNPMQSECAGMRRRLQSLARRKRPGSIAGRSCYVAS